MGRICILLGHLEHPEKKCIDIDTIVILLYLREHICISFLGNQEELCDSAAEIDLGLRCECVSRGSEGGRGFSVEQATSGSSVMLWEAIQKNSAYF